MFIKTIKPDCKPEQRSHKYHVFFSKRKKGESTVMNVTISAETARKAKISKGDVIDVFYDSKNKKMRIARCNDGIKLCELSEKALRATYTIHAGRITSKGRHAYITSTKTSTGVIDFDMPEELHIKRKARKQ